MNLLGWHFPTVPRCGNCGFDSPAGIDVEVGDAGNIIDLNSPDSVEVAILGSADYDAQTTIISSLEFAGAGPVGWWTDLDHWDPSRVKDVNGDGYPDVVATFAISDLQLTPQDTVAYLWGSSPTNTFRLEAPVEVLPVQ